MRPERVEPGPGQESVWDYPRPPALEDFDGLIEVVFGGEIIATTKRAKRVLETSHPPVYYIPPAHVRGEFVREVAGTSWCEWKGRARYYDVAVGERTVERAAWYYPDPEKRYRQIKNYVAFYPALMDACFVNGERVTAQSGTFYGGWITSNIVGPFKGCAGSNLW
ncbi:MAG: DUF427 domain-containing protein [Gemmatimonadales bacterium]|nr:DUF427 domain-containing protein [Gemmatimonadales bacterium]NIN12965.1 DUF427 domain-containing protein [Gemmatimonadales bacterium]NIR02640.1 DUF427 domain-containing protein [Gemmatimonadales bacterium]NIS67216.1 DUF427 domain-containing protein [Gemmatimonadales bacterium]